MILLCSIICWSSKNIDTVRETGIKGVAAEHFNTPPPTNSLRFVWSCHICKHPPQGTEKMAASAAHELLFVIETAKDTGRVIYDRASNFIRSDILSKLDSAQVPRAR